MSIYRYLYSVKNLIERSKNVHYVRVILNFPHKIHILSTLNYQWHAIAHMELNTVSKTSFSAFQTLCTRKHAEVQTCK